MALLLWLYDGIAIELSGSILILSPKCSSNYTNTLSFLNLCVISPLYDIFLWCDNDKESNHRSIPGEEMEAFRLYLTRSSALLGKNFNPGSPSCGTITENWTIRKLRSVPIQNHTGSTRLQSKHSDSSMPTSDQSCQLQNEEPEPTTNHWMKGRSNQRSLYWSPKKPNPRTRISVWIPTTTL
jgi:hypothetical protein